MKTPFHILVFRLSVPLLAALLHADPAMPGGFVTTWTDSSGLTWRETGTLPLAFTNAAAAVKASMKSQGYALRHDIFDKSLPGHRLFLFRKGGEEVTILLSRAEDTGATGLSWGVTRASDSESSAGGDASRTPGFVPPSIADTAHVSSNNTERTTQP